MTGRMETSGLDLGLAIAACARGYTCLRRRDTDEVMVLVEDSIILRRKHGKDCKLENSSLWLDPTVEEWYIFENDSSWLMKDPK